MESIKNIIQKTKRKSEFRFQINSRTLIEERLISEGGSSFVWLVRDAVSGEGFALKKMFLGSREQRERALEEVDVMRVLPASSNLVKLIDWCELRNEKKLMEMNILLEFCTRGTLFDYVQMHQKKNIPEKKIVKILHDVSIGLAVLHSRSFAHNDLKLENIFHSETGEWKIGDFGSCSRTSFAGEKYRSREQIQEIEDFMFARTTLPYRSPELVNLYGGFAVDVRTDIWALGCIAMTLVSREHPFHQKNLLATVRADFCFPDSANVYSSKLHHVINCMLAKYPGDRPSAEQLVRVFDDWFGDCSHVPRMSRETYDRCMKNNSHQENFVFARGVKFDDEFAFPPDETEIPRSDPPETQGGGRRGDERRGEGRSKEERRSEERRSEERRERREKKSRESKGEIRWGLGVTGEDKSELTRSRRSKREKTKTGEEREEGEEGRGEERRGERREKGKKKRKERMEHSTDLFAPSMNISFYNPSSSPSSPDPFFLTERATDSAESCFTYPLLPAANDANLSDEIGSYGVTNYASATANKMIANNAKVIANNANVTANSVIVYSANSPANDSSRTSEILNGGGKFDEKTIEANDRSRNASVWDFDAANENFADFDENACINFASLKITFDSLPATNTATPP